ncbi:MAG: glutamine--fructose-6-phosphate transaminase (isomerizing) [Candidatus Ranarchaeia archaeon]
MCGIIGAVTNDQEVTKIILEALKRLEYRGYDSIGIATQTNSKITIKKDKGRIEEVNEKVNFAQLKGTTGIGHTRWATHGPPTKINSHPHTNEDGTIAVVHNGIVENYLVLKKELIKKGHKFRSDTDTEIIPHLIQEHLQNKKTNTLEKATIATLKQIKGYYAIVVMDTKNLNTIICARNGSPLVLGRGEQATYCASDIPAFLTLTKKVQYLMDGELAILTPGKCTIKNTETGETVNRKLETIKWTIEQAQKGGYPHYMLKEIHEQPNAIKQTLATSPDGLKQMADVIANSKRVFTLACGTSYHACLAGAYMLTHLSKIPTHPVISSEFTTLLHELVDEHSTIIAVSQSGETIDTIHAVKHAKKQGAKVFAITNVPGSSLTRVADESFITAAGPEIGVAATKTFTVQLISLARLALYTGKAKETITQERFDRYYEALEQTPQIVADLINSEESHIERIAKKIAKKQSAFFLGRGISTTTAMEGALKLKEIAYVHAEGYPAGESKHGPIALIEKGFPVIVVAPPGGTYNHIQGNIQEMKARGAEIITITEEGHAAEEMAGMSHHVIKIPKPIATEDFPELLTAITYITPLQLLAYYAAISRGFDSDFPKNLSKSVTVF